MTRLLGPAEIRQLAAEMSIRPTKKLGQNFVHDPNTVRRIVRLASVRSSDVVLEVGPGLGSLTVGLLATGAEVVAVEIDAALAGKLPSTVAQHVPEASQRLTLVTANALTLRASDLVASPTALVANLPYNVAVPVVLHLLAELPTLTQGLVMVQDEVADRMAAKPGSRVYGVPSVKLAWHGDVRKVGAVPRSVFWPVPNVDSALVAFRRVRQTSALDPSELFSLVDIAFSQRRKSLRGVLAAWAGSPARAAELLRSVGIDPQARGEQLAVGDFVRLAQARLRGPESTLAATTVDDTEAGS